MARLPRLAAPGYVHLVTQRGIEGRPLCVDDLDRERLRAYLSEAASGLRVLVHAYALTDCELLLLATPPQADALSGLMQALGRRYVAVFNRRHGRSGALWEGRFRSTAIEPEAWLLRCIAYVELAPVWAGVAAAAQDRPWSSARHHLGVAPDPLVADHALYWSLGNTPFEREAAHRRLLERGLAEADCRILAESASKGWAVGSPAFAARLAQAAGRRVLPAQRGRRRRVPFDG